MKKLISALLVLAVMLSLVVGCVPSEDTTTIRVTTLMGPTGMGMANLFENDKYEIELAAAPAAVQSSLIGGNTDIAAVPVNLAAALYNKTEGEIVVIAVNTLGVLYMLEAGNEVNSIQDLEGKTVYATGQGSTPEYVLDYLLEHNDIAANVVYKSEHAELATLLAAGEVTLGMLPEPNVTATLSKNESLRIALDLNAAWRDATGKDLVQGCIVVRKTFLDENKSAVEQFLTDYSASVAAVNENPQEASQKIADNGIMASAALALKAIPNCNIVYIVGDEMKAALEPMLQALFDANPASVGGEMPDDDFYR